MAQRQRLGARRPGFDPVRLPFKKVGQDLEGQGQIRFAAGMERRQRAAQSESFPRQPESRRRTLLKIAEPARTAERRRKRRPRAGIGGPLDRAVAAQAQCLDERPVARRKIAPAFVDADQTRETGGKLVGAGRILGAARQHLSREVDGLGGRGKGRVGILARVVRRRDRAQDGGPIRATIGRGRRLQREAERGGRRLGASQRQAQPTPVEAITRLGRAGGGGLGQKWLGMIRGRAEKQHGSA